VAYRPPAHRVPEIGGAGRGERVAIPGGIRPGLGRRAQVKGPEKSSAE